MTRDEYIIYLADKVASGEIDYRRIRKELHRQGLNEPQTRSMIKLIDHEVLSRSVAKIIRKRQNSYTIVGIILTMTGFITSIILIGFGPLVYFIGYGPFATGLGLIVAGRRSHLHSYVARRHRVVRSFRNQLLILFSILIPFYAFAQDALWGKFLDSHHGGVAMENRALPTGEVLLFGYYSGIMSLGNQVLEPKYDNHGSYIIKLANDGSLISVTQIDGKSVYVENASIDSQGDLLVVGRIFESIEFDGQLYEDQSESASYHSSFIAKYGGDGTPRWIRIFSNSDYTSLAVDENDDIYIISTQMMDYYHTSSYLRKFNTHGDLLFENVFLQESEAQSYPRCIAVQNNGEVIVGGMVYGSGDIFGSLTYTGNSRGVYIAGFNSDGSVKWAKSLGETAYNNADISDVIFDDNGSFYVAGGLPNNMVLAKYDAQGSLQWCKKSLPQSFTSSYLCKGTDGSIFLATNFYDKAEIDGHILSATPDSNTVLNAPNVAVIKFDEVGNVLGFQQFKPYIVNIVTSISVNPFNEVFISGFSDAPSIEVGIVNITSPDDTQANLGDGYVIKFDGKALDAPSFQILAKEICAKESATFSANFNTSDIKNILWDFGDSGNQNTSNQITPIHKYTKSGLYKIRAVVVDTNNRNWYASLVFEVFETPLVELGSDFTLCEGQTNRIEAGTDNGWTYTWQDASVNAYLDINNAGKYWVAVTNGYCTASDTIRVTNMTAPYVIIGDKILCPGEVYPVDLSAINSSILWNDGSTSPVRNIDMQGDYIVTASNECGSTEARFTVVKFAPLDISIDDGTICQGQAYTVDLSDVPATFVWSTGGNENVKDFFDEGTFTVQATGFCEIKSTTFNVSVIEPFDFDLGNDRYLCAQSQPIALQASIPNAEYRWSNGSTADAITISQPGNYWLEVTTSCHTARDTIEIKGNPLTEMTLPNIITPNGDPQNEYFIVDDSMKDTPLLIFNRWGERVYSSDHYQNNWNAENLMNSVYYYVMPEFCLKGWIHVVR